ncbi:lysosomal cholesterol signaling protein [Planococcus citri]|uniref:lysosomal cholesterol signaling protein n=1 Tax=Planococcus citri TaxID=170843 RepID=UPI0031F86BDE
MAGISNSVDLTKDDTNLDNLYIALTQCFAVIICGYLAGRTHMITQRETSGLNTFVGKFSLPSLIFISLCQIDLSSVNWMFIFAIFVSKTIIFFIVLIITVVVTRPTNTARAGLLAIFCTQTNDFAIGVPIVQALYNSTHPDYVAYLYLLAPISLTILNPFGFVMMEIGKQPAVSPNSQNAIENTRWQMIRNVIRNIISNPIVFMTALGIIGNQIFNHQPPVVLKSVLDVFGSAFTGTALMLLGLRMVGRVHTLQGTALLTPSLLIITKLLLTPLVMREIVALCLSKGTVEEDNLDLATFAFLYGTLPSAPGVFVYANAYGLDIDLVAASMVSCTFLSAPLMFVSAKMIAAASMNPDDYNRLLEAFEFDISLLSLIGGLVVFMVFVTKRRFRFPHRLTFFLIAAQIVGCVSSVLQFYGLVSVPKLLGIASDMCAALCSASLAIALLFIHARADPTLGSVQPALIVLPWGIPLCLTTILISLYRPPLSPDSNPPEPFGMVSNGLSISVFLFSLIVTVVCLVLAERNRRQNARYSSITEDDLPASISSAVMSNSSRDKLLNNKYDNMFDEQANGDVAGRELNGYYRSDSVTAGYGEDDDLQLVRHFVFLMIIVCSFIVSLALKLWRLVSDSPAGLYVEMQFIEITFRRGQALFGFCIFALDYRGVIKPMIKWAVKTWYGGEPITLPKWDTLPFETRLLCDQFVSQHLQKCKIDIEKTKWSSLLYGICFSGSSLVDWLVHNGVCKDSEEAGVYASKLLSGRVIRHIYNTEYFYNSPSMLYTFIVGS